MEILLAIVAAILGAVIGVILYPNNFLAIYLVNIGFILTFIGLLILTQKNDDSNC